MKFLLLTLLSLTSFILAEETSAPPKKEPIGWSFDVGGGYTWMSFTTPPTYSGSTGGILGRVTYQKPWEFFGQLRTLYNLGKLSSSLNHAREYEWYSEITGGYTCLPLRNWFLAPYAGLGFDFLYDDRSAYSGIPSTNLRYTIYYAIAGLETHYVWRDWMFGLQVEALPTFNQYLRVKTMSEAAWILPNRTGASVFLPISYRYVWNFWLELAPYYRFLPIGSSSILSLPSRNLNQWGAFLTFRFFL